MKKLTLKTLLFMVPCGWIGLALIRAWLASRDVTNGLSFGSAFGILIINPFHSWT